MKNVWQGAVRRCEAVSLTSFSITDASDNIKVAAHNSKIVRT